MCERVSVFNAINERDSFAWRHRLDGGEKRERERVKKEKSSASGNYLCLEDETK